MNSNFNPLLQQNIASVMLNNIKYVFQLDKAGIRKAFIWEGLHGALLTIPSTILLFVIWQLLQETPDFSAIWTAISLMAILFIVQLYIANKALLASNKTTYEISRRLRLSLGNKLQRLPLGFYKNHTPSDLAAVILQDVANFEHIFGHSVTNIANALFGTTMLTLFLCFVNLQLTLILIAGILFSIPFILWSRRLVEKLGAPKIDAQRATGSHFLEYVQGIRPIKTFGLTGERFQALDKALLELKEKSIQIEALPAPIVLLSGMIFELFFLIMTGIGVYMLAANTITLPLLITFLILGYRLYEPMKILIVEIPLLSYMNLSLKRIIQVLEAEEKNDHQGLVPTTYEVKFDNVVFGYEQEQPVLNGVSFVAPARQLTALVGNSGAGKTTIMALIARFWEAQEGCISIGGVPIQDMNTATIYSLISEVFQEVYLFDDSIYNNIKIGNPNATKEQLIEAAEQAQVMEFAQDFPKGLDTLVGEGGSKLSGGQKQRISIARALLKDAPIVLLDEATASLDPDNERHIQKAIQNLLQHKTVLVIAHKLSTIQRANQIIVLQDGIIVQQDKHNHLIQQEGLYQHLWQLQQNSKGWHL